MADISQRIVWTALPDGYAEDGQGLRVNVHVSPRLSLAAGIDPADLSQFPSWQRWPQVIEGARFVVRIGGVVFDAPERAPLAEQAVWEALFPVITPVIPHAFDDHRGKDVLTPPLAELENIIAAIYTNLAASPDPDGGLPLLGKLRYIEEFAPREKQSLQQLLHMMRDRRDPELFSSPGIAIAALEAYHRPLEKPVEVKAPKTGPDDPHEDAVYRSTERTPLPDPAEYQKRIDFHRIVSALGQHPHLMRLTGLVVPLLVPAQVGAGEHDLSIEVRWDDGGVETERDVLPATRIILTDRIFQAKARDPALLDGGWLRASDDRFALVQMDVDGAGLSLKNFATSIPRIEAEMLDDENFNVDRPARAGTPRLRSAGLQFAEIRRDVAIRGLFDGAGKLDDTLKADAPITLFAEDVIRGWRIDVLHDGVRPEWRSLVRFDGRYRLEHSGDVRETEDEEGIARLSATKSTDGSNPNVLKASSALFAWAGWSLAAPEPGKAVMPDDSVGVPPNEVPPGLPLHTSFKAHPKSLPALRFGRNYTVRLRYADLAGAGEPFTPKPVARESWSRPVFYGRYEPIETPPLALADGDPNPADGESMPRAALRTMDDPARGQDKVRRIVAAPRVAHRFAETHGALDDADGRPRADLYPLLGARDQAYPSIQVETPAWVPQGGGEPAIVATEYAVAPPEGTTPYLPDPLAGGVALRVGGLPGIDPQEVHKIPFYADDWDPAAPLDWPNARTFSIVAIDGDEPEVRWVPDERVFRVTLPKAERARIRMSALPTDQAIRQLKLVDLVRKDSEARWKRIERMVRDGDHWMFTPSRIVELVHAVQRPLIVPDFQKMSAFRAPGALVAEIGLFTPLHAKSTMRLDMAGEWLEIDDTGEAPAISARHADAFERKFARLDTPTNDIQTGGQHVFADTRCRRVFYTGTATTRFREFMPGDIRESPNGEAMTVVSQPARLWVPSSASPPAPGILYVVPTFGWTGGGGGGEQRRWRHGGGLRVYLDRPWFATGFNEMLGVVLPRGPGDPQTGATKNYVSQWGADPIWRGGRIRTIAPARSDFPLRRDGGPVPYAIPGVDPGDEGVDLPNSFLCENLYPPGSPPGTSVDVVPHPVGYDPERKLWYADIVIRPGEAYYPFVRLALARYQPMSIGGTHLSPVVLAEFQQLTPDRLLIVGPGPGADGRVRRVRLHGVAPLETPWSPIGAIVKIEVQTLKPDGDEDLDWRTVSQGSPLPDLELIDIMIRRGSGLFETDRAMLAPNQHVLLREAERLIDRGAFEAVLARPDLIELLRPPLIHEEDIILPSRGEGERMRLLVTEWEAYAADADRKVPAEQRRIVYAETVEI
jgi:hypothetical protein